MPSVGPPPPHDSQCLAVEELFVYCLVKCVEDFVVRFLVATFPGH